MAPQSKAMTYLTHHERKSSVPLPDLESYRNNSFGPLDNKAVMFGTPTRLEEAAGNQVWHEPVGRLAAVVSQVSHCPK